MNIRRLAVGKDGCARICFFGDLHIGAKTHDSELVDKVLAKCLSENIYIVGMGDYCEAGTRESVGSSLFEQTSSPQEQLDRIIGLLKPFSATGLLLGVHGGNHEERIFKNTGINLGKVIADNLKTRYLGDASFNLFMVGGNSFKVFTMHGRGNSATAPAKLAYVMRMGGNVNSDLFVCGHMHDLIQGETTIQDIDKKKQIIVDRKRKFLISGSFLSWDTSYAQASGMSPGRLGSPVAIFNGDSNKKEININFLEK
jgi:predicted phosphodiesterase